MADEPETEKPSALTDRRLRIIYIVGIAFNLIALSIAIEAGEPLFILTFAVIIAYLAVRYWMVATRFLEDD